MDVFAIDSCAREKPSKGMCFLGALRLSFAAGYIRGDKSCATPCCLCCRCLGAPSHGAYPLSRNLAVLIAAQLATLPQRGVNNGWQYVVELILLLKIFLQME